MSMTATMLGLGGLGWYLDGRLQSSPVCLILGLFAGFSLGLRNLIHESSRTPPDDRPPADPED
jgi:F0F1-type ATP synthase assembly protein I